MSGKLSQFFSDLRSCRCGFTGLVIALLCSIVASPVWAQKSTASGGKKGRTAASDSVLQEYTSRNFLLRTDYSAEEAKELLERLETMLLQVGRYWGKPNAQIIEMYVIKELKNWPDGSIPPAALESVSSGGGLTLSVTRSAVDRSTGKKTAHLGTKSVVYAVADRGTPLHEAVHAYCSQTFGTTGPTWFSEGIAELGNYWRDKDNSVHLYPVVLEYLQQTEPVALTEIVDLRQQTGDSWQNYAWRWALCHMLAFNPNYAARFRPLGMDMLQDGNETFESVYGSMAQEISFEYLQFLSHIDNGYRVDLCSWDWKTKAVPVRGKSSVQAKIDAGRGWQATRLKARAGETYEFTVEGEWQTSAEGDEVTADGNAEGQGRLIGVLFDNYELSEPFELGVTGTWTAPGDGAVYVRCRDDWNSIADNSGKLTVRFTLAD